ncbi:MAG: COX15/CtaA family protein [Proteobacteria bacterium]|nr:COX15/CtaA family protein [Pseudomonadota bacterium]
MAILRFPLSGMRRLAWAAAAFALVVIVFGAFVRLSNAGLSCPDWPTCYGKLTWPVHAHEIAHADANFPQRPFEADKAWREQVHRILVGVLSLLTFALAAWAWIRRREIGRLALVPYAAAGFIFFQAALGMWTVTWKLLPLVVTSHLVGGMAMFALLAYTALRLSLDAKARVDAPSLRRMTIAGIVLVAIQIALGGWTSSNYAALSCGTDFPTCLMQWWPAMDFHQAFILLRHIGVDYEGGVLDGPARVAIQMVHRIGALVVFAHVLALAIRTARIPVLRGYGIVVGVLLITQVCLGISNVMFALPLPVAAAHNLGAALLLFALLALAVRLRPVPR